VKGVFTKRVVIVLAVLAVYIVVLARLTVFRDGGYTERQLNLTLFENLISIYHNGAFFLFLWLLLGNIGWFVPWGFLLPVLSRRMNFWKTMLAGLGFSLLIETVQYLSYMGVAELDDLILNTAGTALGFGFFALLSRMIPGLRPPAADPG
jgi:glycopeptide antibiotics resistance protein